MNGYSRIVRAVQAHTGINRAFIMSRRREAPIANARALAMYLAYSSVPDSTITKVGTYFDRDHATIRTAVNKIEGRMAASEAFAEQVGLLWRGLGGWGLEA